MAETIQRSTLLEPNPDRIIDIPVEKLLLDSENARLAWIAESDTQKDLVRILWTEMAVDEVAWSIAENGFFRSEPLFVILKNPEEKDPIKQECIVVEGNRRTVAVLLLRDERLRQEIKATNLPRISEERREELGKLPAIVYPSRESLWATVGFRHINGIKPWDSFNKAIYIAEVHETYDVPLEKLAEKIGDHHATVKRLYRGYKLLEQAEAEGVFDRKDTFRGSLHFSHLYTAADQRAFQDFLGIDPETSLQLSPVPKSKVEQLEEFMTWLYGKRSAGIEPVIRTQNPDLRYLREVISRPASLAILRSGYSLERALDVAVGDKRRFRDALESAKLEMQNAKGTVTTGYFGDDDLYDTIQEIIRYAETIKSEMEAKRDEMEIEEPRQTKKHSASPRRR